MRHRSFYATPEPIQKNKSSGWGASAFGRPQIWFFWMGFDNILVGAEKKIEGPCQHGRYETLDPSPEIPCHGRE